MFEYFKEKSSLTSLTASQVGLLIFFSITDNGRIKQQSGF
jgi:hypothetical protein